MAYGTLQTDVINSSTGLFSTNNAYSGIAKAWLNYNGATQTINSSFNISSVTYNATGNYTINFTTAMANTNYILAGYTEGSASGNTGVFGNQTAGILTKTTSAKQIQVGYVTGSSGGMTLFDTTNVYVVFLGA